MSELDAQDGESVASQMSCREIERVICDIWSDHFGREILRHDDFFDLGGDSLTMIDMVLAARRRGIGVRSSTALRNPTPARLAESLTIRAEGAAPAPDPGPQSGRDATGPG